MVHEQNGRKGSVKVNVSRFRRAIDYTSDFTTAEKLVVGVIADHHNEVDGYAYPTQPYLMTVYGFSSSVIHSAIVKMKSKGWMRIENPEGNNRYYLSMEKAEAVLDEWDRTRARWKKDGGKGVSEFQDKATSDHMSRAERYTLLRGCYEHQSGKQQPDEDDLVAQQIFSTIDDKNHFARILLGISEVQSGSERTFADHLKHWRPDLDYPDQDEGNDGDHLAKAEPVEEPF